MQTITCQPLPVLTQVMSGFGEQREVHENAKSDRRLHGAGPIPGRSAIKGKITGDYPYYSIYATLRMNR